jgi:hypothetical protein
MGFGHTGAPGDYPWATGIQASDQQHGFKQVEAT